MSTRAEARDSLRYLAWHYPILFTYSSLKIRDDGTRFPGHTLTLFLVNCLLYSRPRNSRYSKPFLKNYVPNWSSHFQLWGEIHNNPFSTFTGYERGRFQKIAWPPPGRQSCCNRRARRTGGKQGFATFREQALGMGESSNKVKGKLNSPPFLLLHISHLCLLGREQHGA